MPIWRDENRGEKCIGSLEELYAEIEKSVAAYELSGVLGHGSGSNGSSGFFYLMLFNPGATFRSVLSSQIGVGNEIADFFPWLEQGPVSFVSEHWMLFGTVTQIGLAVA